MPVMLLVVLLLLVGQLTAALIVGSVAVGIGWLTSTASTTRTPR